MVEIAQTADHALRILIELGDGEPLSPGELAERLDLNRTVVHRLLATLSARGFVHRNGALYRPGAAVIRLADVLEPDLRAAAWPAMRRLVAATGESCVLHLPDDVYAVVTSQVVGRGHVLQVSHQIGARHLMAVGASGRAILAFLPPVAKQRIVDRHDDIVHLERNLAGVEGMGYATSHDELQTGVHGIAAPILDESGYAVASLAILVPVLRSAGIESHLDDLWAATGAISANIDPGVDTSQTGERALG